MKAEGHPDYHTITIKMTDGTTYQTRSTWGKEGDTMNLDIDPLTHPAWSDGNTGKVIEKGALSKFEKRFAGFGSLTSTGDKKK
jgi:large subunit ribosomal protein L31